MAKIFDKDNVALMSFGKAMSRMAAQPLDESEIWYDLAELTEYAKNGETAYVGMKVTYVDETNNKVYQYSIQTDGTLKEIGVAPLGDGKSITVSAEGVVSILGVENADSLTLPRMKEDKSGIEWVPVSAVVEGDGNDNTTYTFTPITKGEGEDAETYGFTVETFFNGVKVEGGEFEFAFDVYTKSETDAAIKVVADKVGVPAEGDTSTDTLYERIAAEVLRATNAESALSDRIGVAKNGETAATGVYAYVDGVINAIVEGVDPDKIDSLNELIAWVEAHPDIVSGLDERLGTVEEILDGIGGEGEKATVKAYVDDAFTAHENAADNKYATKQEITNAGYAVATEVARDYATKQELTNHNTAADAKYATKEELAPVTQTANNAATKADNLETRINDIVATGGEPNAINTIKVNGTALTIDAQKAVDITVPTSITGMDGYSALDGRVTQNANDIDALEGQLGTTNTNVSGLTNRLAALEAEVGEVAESRIDALEGVTAQHTTDIGTNTAAITTLSTETIPALQQSVTNEATARDNADKAILATIGTVESGKTVVDMINAVAGTIDFTPYATNERVDTIYKAAEGETPASGILATAVTDIATNADNIATLVGSDANKSARTIATEVLAGALEGASEDFDTLLEMAEWLETHSADAIEMDNRITANTNKLAGIDTTVTAYVETAIANAAYSLPAATAETLGGIKSAADVEGAIAVNKVYVDATTNIGEVKALSTDNLVQGTMTLVLNGGDAQVTA